MEASVSAPFLARVKSWQLVGLGLTGWCTLYSVAILTWGSSSTIIGNTQGVCFAATMSLAGIEVKRYKKGGPMPVDPLGWINGLTAEQLNQAMAQVAQKQFIRVEPLHEQEIELGFGVRGVSAGRTLVFETGRWKEPVIDLVHTQATDENRKKICADLVIIVGTGTADEAARAYVETHPVQLLIGKELGEVLATEKPVVNEV